LGSTTEAAVAQTLVALVALGQLLGDWRSVPAATSDQNCGARILVKLAVAPDIAPFEQRGADRQVALGLAHRLVERAARMSTLSPRSHRK
jgi:hypothetical protein